VASSAPLLTVAIPTCNGAVHLAETLHSILSQECEPFDLIVSDDCSEDETVPLVRAEAGERARIVVNERRLGLAGNWNQCVSRCETPLIAIVHQDDILGPGHLAAHRESFGRDNRIGLTCSASTVIDDQGGEVPANVIEPGGLGTADRIFDSEELFESMAIGNPLRCSAVTIRVAAHRDVGGFDPSYRYVVDWDFWFRVARHWRVAWLAMPTVKVRWHQASETHRFKTGRADLDETKRMLESLFLDDLPGRFALDRLRKKSERRLARAFLNRAHDALGSGQIDLARNCLSEAVRLSPQIVGVILADPRLALQMSTLGMAPRLARRWFSVNR